MTRSSLALAAVIASLLGACGTDTATKEPEGPPAAVAEPPVIEREVPRPPPETEEDRAIRHELNRAIAKDPQLKDRTISFVISDGDISVTGTVRSEVERRKINEIAMSVTGVKSVANALRIED